jgi:hypothetical protein
MGRKSREAEEWRQKWEAEEREYFVDCIKEMEDDIEWGVLKKEMPWLGIVK